MMTEIQQKRARALRECSFPVHGNCKRFVGQMVQAAYDPALAIISANQDKALAGWCWHFRRQLTELGHAEVIPPSNPYKVEPKPEPVTAAQVELPLL